MEEEGDTITPISGDIDSNFAGLEAERKKKLRNQIIIWGAASLGIIIAVTIIIILILNSGGEKGEQGKGKDGEKDDKKDDEDDGPIPEEVFGNITCIYEVNQGEINILSDEFEKSFDIVDISFLITQFYLIIQKFAFHMIYFWVYKLYYYY